MSCLHVWCRHCKWGPFDQHVPPFNPWQVEVIDLNCAYIDFILGGDECLTVRSSFGECPQQCNCYSTTAGTYRIHYETLYNNWYLFFIRRNMHLEGASDARTVHQLLFQCRCSHCHVCYVSHSCLYWILSPSGNVHLDTHFTQSADLHSDSWCTWKTSINHQMLYLVCDAVT